MATADQTPRAAPPPGGAPGDGDIFSSLYPSLRRYAAVVGSLSDNPDDLVQEAVARTLATTSLAQLGSPGAYLRRVISNLVINGARSDTARRGRTHMLLGDGEWRDIYPSDLDLLERLGSSERAAVFLADVEGWPFRDVAEILGCSPVAARLRAVRGRRRLRRFIEEES
jgi:DNA-directed RNA polymerase specialized sigma24 family protein